MTMTMTMNSRNRENDDRAWHGRKKERHHMSHDGHDFHLDHSPRFDLEPKTGKPRRLVLLKGEHRWTFRYTAGEEEDLCRAIERIAQMPGSGLTWTDAAVATQEMTRRDDRSVEHQ